MQNTHHHIWLTKNSFQIDTLLYSVGQVQKLFFAIKVWNSSQRSHVTLLSTRVKLFYYFFGNFSLLNHSFASLTRSILRYRSNSNTRRWVQGRNKNINKNVDLALKLDTKLKKRRCLAFPSASSSFTYWPSPLVSFWPWIYNNEPLDFSPPLWHPRDLRDLHHPQHPLWIQKNWASQRKH